MKVGLQISSFTWPGGDAAIGADAGAAWRSWPTRSASTPSGSWTTSSRSGSVGAPDEPMLEGWTTLGYLAALTQRARLGLMVGGIHYRQAGLWLKAATTLDVLSGGPRLVRHRRGLERGGVARPGLPHAAARRALRDARGDAPLRARRLDRRARHRGAPSRAARVQASTPAQQPPGAQPAAPARSSSAAAASSRRCAWWPATRMPATCSAARSRSPTSTTCCAATATTEGRDYDAIEKTNLTCDLHHARRRPGLAHARRAGGPPGRAGPRPAPSTPSSASATCGTCPSWSSSAATCCRRSASLRLARARSA